MQDNIKQIVSDCLRELYDIDKEVEIDQTEEQFGDYSSNIAFHLSATVKKSPLEIAEEITAKISSNNLFNSVKVAGPGFVNFTLANSALIDNILIEPQKYFSNQTIVVEFSDPNPFKILHAGHLYTSVVGDVIANLLEVAGATVHRVNFGGDIGTHVAKTLWAVTQELGGEIPDKLNDITENERLDFLSRCYVKGNKSYEEEDGQIKNDIKSLSKRIYDIAVNHDHSTPLAKIYWQCRQWSYDYFESFYGSLNINFEKYYPESEVAELGKQIVMSHMPDVYQESQGAVIFDGQKYGLYSNVFINNQGVPTYAAKDVGLIFRKWQDFHYDKSIIITGSEQDGYMKVVLKSVSFFEPKMVDSTVHITHGLVKFSSGQKMSSRTGKAVAAKDVIDAAYQVAKEKDLSEDSTVILGAIRYTFLKQRIGGDILYDPKESVSLDGNSGPYLQYAYARAHNILIKVDQNVLDLKSIDNFTSYERSLLRKMASYNDALDLAIKELKPHYLTTYLYELSQVFNRFYENSRVIGDERQDIRLAMIRLYVDKLGHGLKVLGVEPIERM